MTDENNTPDEGQEDIIEENNEPTIEDAIEDAIIEVSPHLEEEDDDATPADDAGADEGGDVDDDTAHSNAPDDKPAGDKDADAAADDSGDSADTDGADKAGDKPGEDGDAVDPASEPDHINDPIPESTNTKTAERIQGLIDIAKTQTERAGQGDEIVAAIGDAGADPEQFSNTLGFLGLYNSKDPVQRKQALEVARGVVHELSIELGEGSVDLLAQHSDLQDEVEAGTLDQARAIEIATGRAQKALSDSRTTHANETTARDEETTRLIGVGKNQLTEFEAIARTDPDYARLNPTFVGVLRTTLRQTHPSEWGETAKTIYAQLKANLPAAPVTPTPKPSPRTPLRAQQGAGGGGDKAEEPKSAVESMDAALADM